MIMGVEGGWLCGGTAGCFPFPLLLVAILENNKEGKEVGKMGEQERGKKKGLIGRIIYKGVTADLYDIDIGNNPINVGYHTEM